jgi:ABC-type lipopolysaccharide export system ATPase subunit
MNTAPLNTAQMHLLKLFTRPMSVEEVDELKSVLAKFYMNKVQDEIDEIWQSKGLKTKLEIDNFLATNPKCIN